jgi:alkane 1-monooxygenase
MTTTTIDRPPLTQLRHSLPFVLGYIPMMAGFLAVWGISHQQGWGYGVVPVTLFVIIPIVDWVAGTITNSFDDSAHPPPRSMWFDLWLWAWLPLQAVLLIAALSIANHTSPSAWICLAIAVGLVTGIGITVAHELMHRRGKSERALAELLMMTTSYTHFCVEHVLGHHKHVATPDDPASAAPGELIYRYWWKTISGGLRSAWRLETKRTATMNLRGMSLWHDRRVRYPVAMAMLWMMIAMVWGWLGLGLFLAQSLVAVLLLETINFVEHYGLCRAQRADGSYERCMPEHSWNAPQRFTHWLLFALQRHSDHHHLASRPFFALRHKEEAPQLPTGYAGMVVLSLVPPLWRMIMDPRVEAWRAKHAFSDPLPNINQ